MKFAYYLLFIPLSFAVQAQTITGTILDEEKQPIPHANVLLFDSNQVMVQAAVAGIEGHFTIYPTATGDYTLQIRAISFSTKTIPLKVESNKVKALGEVIIALDAQQLEAVEVMDERPFIEMQADKMVVNVSQSVLSQGQTAWEVLERLPGVLVSNDNQINLRGKSGVQIMINGRLQMMSSQQLASILKGMPASSVKAIEIITNPSAKYDAEGNAGILNIKLLKQEKMGWNGMANLRAGKGRYPSYGGHLSLGRKLNKSAYTFMASHNDRDAFNNLVINREFNNGNKVVSTFNTNNYMKMGMSNTMFRTVADYTINDKAQLSILANGGLMQHDLAATTFAQITEVDPTQSRQYYFDNDAENLHYNYAASTQLDKNLDTIGRKWVISLDYARYASDDGNVFNTYWKDAEGIPLTEIHQRGEQYGDLNIYAGKFDYTHPIGNTLFEAGVKTSLVTSENEVLFYQIQNEEEVLDTTISNHFLYDENINSGYINYKYTGTGWSIQLGLRGEHTYAIGDQVTTGDNFTRNYFQLFPSLFLARTLSKDHQVNISATRRIDRPRYQMLNPFIRFIDATSFGMGDPNLLPQITYNFEVTHTFKQSLFTTASASVSTNHMTSVLLQNFDTRQTIQTFRNIEYLYSYNLGVTYSKRIIPWWHTNSSITGVYSTFAGEVEGLNIDRSAPTFFLNSTNRFIVGKNSSLELGIRYNYRNVYAITEVRDITNINVGFQQQLWDRKASISINLSDVFWTAYPRGITEFDGVKENWNAIRDTRVFRINFQYQLGQGQSPKMRRDTGADEEKQRVG